MTIMNSLIIIFISFISVLFIIAIFCITQAWYWERKYERPDKCSRKIIKESKECNELWNTEMLGEDDIEMRRRWDYEIKK